MSIQHIRDDASLDFLFKVLREEAEENATIRTMLDARETKRRNGPAWNNDQFLARMALALAADVKRMRALYEHAVMSMPTMVVYQPPIATTHPQCVVKVITGGEKATGSSLSGGLDSGNGTE